MDTQRWNGIKLSMRSGGEELIGGIKGELFGARTVLPVSSLFFVTFTFFPIYPVVVVRGALREGNIPNIW